MDKKNISDVPQFTIKSEVFEHGLYPPPTKLTILLLQTLNQNLQQISNSENQVTILEFVQQSCKIIPNFSPQDAESFFHTYKLVSQNQEQKKIMADVNCISVYMFLLMRYNINDNKKNQGFLKQYNENFQQNTGFNTISYSPLNSPRSKTTRLIQIDADQQQTLQFVKYNIKIILQFFFGFQENLQGNYNIYFAEQKYLYQIIKSNQFAINLQRLSFILNTDFKQFIMRCNYIIGQILEQSIQKFQFMFGIKTKNKYNNEKNLLLEMKKIIDFNKKLDIDNLSDILQKQLSISESINSMSIQGLIKSVATKQISDCSNKDVKINSCEDSFIYLDSNVQSLLIQNCINCVIFVASVEKITTVDKCENIKLTLVSNLLKIGNTIDSTFHFYGPNGPILCGDNRNIILGPHNANYLELAQRVKDSKIQLNQIYCEKFKNVTVMNNNSHSNYQFEQIQDFFPIPLPNQFKYLHFNILRHKLEDLTVDPQQLEILQRQIEQSIKIENKINNPHSMVIPILAPDDYKEQIVERYKKYDKIQKIIKKHNLNDDQIQILQSNIQGQFKEWMSDRGVVKPLNDLVKLIDQD